jgi:hypothetical protein
MPAAWAWAAVLLDQPVQDGRGHQDHVHRQAARSLGGLLAAGRLPPAPLRSVNAV